MLQVKLPIHPVSYPIISLFSGNIRHLLLIALKVKIRHLRNLKNMIFMKRAYLLIGGNLGNPLLQMHRATQLIAERCGTLLLMSRAYRSAAWGPILQPDFYNRALLLQTALSPNALLDQLLQIENELGRIRKEKFGPRLIDIDILLMDDVIIEAPDLQIPHPLLAERRFALMPLCEIAPFLRHPVHEKTIESLLIACTDTGNVQKK